MGAHDGRDVFLDGGPEGDQLHGIGPGPANVQARQLDVGVLRRVPVPREVLRRAHEAVILHSPELCRGQPRHRHRGRVLAVAPGVDDGVRRVVVHVEDRREREVDPHGPGLERRDPAQLVRQRRVPRRAQRHDRREPGAAAQVHAVRQDHAGRETLSGPVLHVRSDEQRHIREALQVVQLGRHVHRRADGDHEPADLVVVHPGGDGVVLRAAGRQEGAVDPRHEELADLLAEGQVPERRLDPGPRLAIQGPPCHIAGGRRYRFRRKHGRAAPDYECQRSSDRRHATVHEATS